MKKTNKFWKGKNITEGSKHIAGFNGQTLLHRAVLSATPEAIKILLDHGADPNSRNNHNETPTLFACRRGHPAVLHTLVSRGGRLDVNDNSGKGPVHHAAHGGAV